MKKELNINEIFWKTLDGWLSEGADKGSLSELFLGVGTKLQQDLKGKNEGKEVSLNYVESIADAEK